MEFLNYFVTFLENILNLKIGLDNIILLDIIIYLLFISAVITFISISVKGKK